VGNENATRKRGDAHALVTKRRYAESVWSVIGRARRDEREHTQKQKKRKWATVACLSARPGEGFLYVGSEMRGNKYFYESREPRCLAGDRLARRCSDKEWCPKG
jgi:hypothetical protein